MEKPEGARAPRISLAMPYVSARSRMDVARCMSHLQLSRGVVTSEFEENFALATGTRYAIATNSGTGALHAALWAAGVRLGHYVICPTLTYAGTLNAITACGASAVLVDVDPHSWGLSRDMVFRVLDSLGQRVEISAIVPVHLYGVATDIGSFVSPRSGKRIPIIEDAAEALKAKAPNGRTAGNIGDAGIFSFFGNKIIASGEGGMIVTNDPDMYASARRFCGQGQSDTQRYHHDHHGMNYRMTEMSAAVANGTLLSLDEVMSVRRTLWNRYEYNLRDTRNVCVRPIPLSAKVSPWLMPVLFHDSQSANHAREMLSEAGVETRNMFVPMHRLDAVSSSHGPHYGHIPFPPDKGGGFPVSDDIESRCLVLPLHTGMSTMDVDYICEVIY